MGFRKFSHIQNMLLLCVCGGAVALLFQNCADPGAAKNPGKYFVRKGNGDGYGGKLTSYVNIDLHQACADGSNEKSKIQVNKVEAKAYVVREDCRNIQAKEIPLAGTGLMPHNASVLFYQTRVFNLQDSDGGVSNIVCRGKWWDGARNENLAADAVISYAADDVTNSAPDLRSKSHARVILGVYDAEWKLLETHDSNEVSVTAVNFDPGHISFLSQPSLGNGKMFALDIVTSNFIGSLSYILSFPSPQPQQQAMLGLSEPPLISPIGATDANGGNPPPTSNDGVKNIPNMQCYEQ